jgi:DNA/RNA endonuclease YhcR with UshA esterase domain
MEMKALLLALWLTLTAAPAFAQTISPLEAKDHVGQNVTVEGTVSEVDHAASGKMIFIDMGGHYPNNVFAGVIFIDDAGKFPGVDSLDGKVVDITGTIKFYQGRTEIILNDPAQIKAK